jgi:hypothetical protein
MDPIVAQLEGRRLHYLVISAMGGKSPSVAGLGKIPCLVRILGWEEDSARMGADHLIGFVRVDFRSDERIFGIKDEDRLLHLYVICKAAREK